MTPTQRVALWERVNAYAEVCGGDTSDGAVGADRQRAVVALESEIECFERKAGAPSWLGDAAEALGEVRPGDGAPKALNWTQVIGAIRDLHEERDALLGHGGSKEVNSLALLDLYRDRAVAAEEDRDEWKLKAEQAEYHHECCRNRSHQ